MKKLCSIVLALALTACLVFPAAAADITDPVVIDTGETVTIDNNIDVPKQSGFGSRALSVTNGSEVTVNGDVSISGFEAEAVFASEGTVTVNGNVSIPDGLGTVSVAAANGSEVTVNGDVSSSCVGVLAAGDSTVTVSGSVSSNNFSRDAVSANTGGRIIVEGDVQSATGTGVHADGGAVVIVEGSASAPKLNGVYLQGTGVARVGGDASGNVGIYTMSDAAGGAVVVEGEVSGTETDLALWFYEGVAPADVVVGSLANGTAEVHKNTGTFVDVTGDPAGEAVLKAVMYIITTDGVNVTSGGDTYENAALDAIYDVAREDDVLTVAVDKKDGYSLKSVDWGKYATVKKNGDGTYTVTVNRGGDLNFKAVFKPANSGRVAYGVGSKVRLGGASFIITDIDDEGNWTVSATAPLTEEQLANLEAVLKGLLSEEQLEAVLAGEDGSLCSLTDQAAADEFFGGDVNHLSFRCRSDILNR